MLRAVPSTILMAASTEPAFRSAFFRSAISRTWSRVTLPTLVLLGSPDAQRDAGGLLEEHRRRRALQDELERPVRIDRDLDRDDRPRELARPLVELGHELADVHAVLAERRPDGRRGRRLAARTLELDLRRNLLRHIKSFTFRRPAGSSRYVTFRRPACGAFAVCQGDRRASSAANCDTAQTPTSSAAKYVKSARPASTRVRPASAARRSSRSRAPGPCRVALRRRCPRSSRTGPA